MSDWATNAAFGVCEDLYCKCMYDVPTIGGSCVACRTFTNAVSALRAAKDEGIEEAAKVCDEMANGWIEMGIGFASRAEASIQVAEEIRSLKSTAEEKT